MAQRRKIEVPIPDFDGDKPDVALSFQKAANEVTKLYQQAANFQHSSFDAGRRHALAKAYEWISSQMQDGKSVTSADVMAYVQTRQLETSAQRSGSNHSHMSRDAHVEANSASSSSTAAIESREPGENVPFSQDQAMDEDPA